MNADLLSDAIGKAEADAIGKARALADRIDAKYGDSDEAETSLGLTYGFLNDINELSDAVVRGAKVMAIRVNVLWRG